MHPLEGKDRHPLEGRWTSRVFNHDAGDPPAPKDDGSFNLVINDEGDVLAGSTHTRPDQSVRNISGRALPNALILREEGTNFIFSGVLLPGTSIQLLLIGDAGLPDPCEDRERKRTGQEQGTWVATKP